jgi:predicted GNAT family acetyltransferase
MMTGMTEFNEADVAIADADADGRYELSIHGEVVGVSTYRDIGERRVFDHTEVDSAYEGHGLASKLVTFALDDVRDKGKRIVARCAMVKAHVEKHHEWDDIVDNPRGVDA